MSTTRREFFARTGAGAVGAALAAGLGAAVSPRAASAAKKPAGKVQVKVGGRTGTIGRSGPAALDYAKKLALDGIEIEAGGPADRLTCADPELQKQFLAEAKKTGTVVSSICMGLCNSYPVFSDPRAKQWIEQTIDATAALNAKVILVPFFGRADLRGKQAERLKTIEVLKSVADKAEQKGITLALENTLRAEENIEIVEKVGSPFVRVYYDIGNSTYNGYDVPKEIRMLGTKYIAQFHFKDGGFLLGRGRVDMAAVREAVEDIGYKGWILLETSRRPLGAELSAVYNGAFIRGLFC